MKLTLGDKPLTSMFSHTDSDDATIVASDMQSGMTAYARGAKITGTGKAFNFASYGLVHTNQPIPVPSDINLIVIASTIYPIQMIIPLSDMKNTDFSTEKTVGTITIGGTAYSITVKVESNMLTIGCDQEVKLECFYGKDNHVGN